MAGESIWALALKWLRIFAIGRRPKWTLVRLAVLVIVTFAAYEFVLVPVRVTGISMEPTYHNGSINVLNRLSYHGGRKPERGDVVGIRMAGEHAVLLKRLVGLPGEQIGFHGGVVWIDGAPIPEPYLRFNSGWEIREERLGPDEYYFVGDNRSMGKEYHEHGKAGRERIIGKVLLAGNQPRQVNFQ